MIIKIGNLFESNAKTLVNTINCVGVMGKGIALEFKKRFPDMFDEYVSMCDSGIVSPGTPYVYQDLYPKLSNKGSLAFPLQAVLHRLRTDLV